MRILSTGWVRRTCSNADVSTEEKKNDPVYVHRVQIEIPNFCDRIIVWIVLIIVEGTPTENRSFLKTWATPPPTIASPSERERWRVRYTSNTDYLIRLKLYSIECENIFEHWSFNGVPPRPLREIISFSCFSGTPHSYREHDRTIILIVTGGEEQVDDVFIDDIIYAHDDNIRGFFSPLLSAVAAGRHPAQCAKGITKSTTLFPGRGERGRYPMGGDTWRWYIKRG